MAISQKINPCSKHVLIIKNNFSIRSLTWVFFVFLYLSNPILTQTTPLLFHAIGESSDSYLSGAGGIGDQNGDGYNDIIIRKTIHGNKHDLLFFGGDPMDTIPDFDYGNRGQVMFTANLNGDNIPDFCLWDEIYFGGMPLHEEPDLKFPRYYNGKNLYNRNIGDVNGDGFDDIVGFDYANVTNGYIAVYYGGPEMDSIPEHTWVGETENTILYYHSNAGFFNEDLINDVILDKYLFQPNIEFNIHLGPDIDQEPDTVFVQTVSNDSLYFYGADYYDDFNSDGFPEISMRPVPINNYTGDTIKYFINGGPGYNPENVYSVIDYPWGFVSLSKRFIGDVNGDGYNDLLMGSTLSWVPFGGILLYLGGPVMGPNPTHYWIGSYNGAPDPALGTGRSMSWCGDVNGDGLDDILFSARTHPFGENRRGHVYIYSGNTAWVNPSVSIKNEYLLPQEFLLKNPYPNPFNSSVTIQYNMQTDGIISLNIYDLKGGIVSTLFDGHQSAGEHQMIWNADQYSSGIYFIQLFSNSRRLTQKVILLK